MEVAEVTGFISLEHFVTYLTSKLFCFILFYIRFFLGFKSEKILDVSTLWLGKEK